MSIARAQAEALAEGFLDNLGTGKEGLRPKKTFSELIILAGEFVEDAQDNLNASNSNASGNLSESIIAGEPEIKGNVFKVDVYMEYYGLFINSGVKGTKSGSGKYAFKYDKPSKSHVQAMLEGLKNAKLKTRSVTRYSAAGKSEAKNKKLSEYDRAYAAARSVKMYGIQATGFIDKAVSTTEKRVSDRLGAAFEIDILTSLI